MSGPLVVVSSKEMQMTNFYMNLNPKQFLRLISFKTSGMLLKIVDICNECYKNHYAVINNVLSK